MSFLIHTRRRDIGEEPSGPIVPGDGLTYQSKNFSIDNSTDFQNPERGWYVEDFWGDFRTPKNNPSPVSGVAPLPTLQMRYVRLDDYRTSSSLPNNFLNTLRTEMQAWRSSGRKAVLRYAYNRGAATTNNDASLTNTLNHINQLGALWRDYKDVIGVLQAGFIGRWGEWNQSSSGNLALNNRNAIIDGLLAAAHPDTMISLRTPFWHYGRWPNVLVPADAFNGSPQARTGAMNDSFLAGTSHGGTFSNETGQSFEQGRTYWRELTKYTVYGGETSDLGGTGAVNNGPAALAEMTSFNLDYLNSEFWTPMISTWSNTGHLAEISRRLGYRLVLDSITVPEVAPRGQSFTASINIRNVGFGKVYNPRPIDLVLSRPGYSDIPIRLTNDARRDLPRGGQSAVINYTVTLPQQTNVASYGLSLRLPDPSPAISADSRYAIRLANQGMWDSGKGTNSLALSMQVV